MKETTKAPDKKATSKEKVKISKPESKPDVAPAEEVESPKKKEVKPFDPRTESKADTPELTPSDLAVLLQHANKNCDGPNGEHWKSKHTAIKHALDAKITQHFG